MFHPSVLLLTIQISQSARENSLSYCKIFACDGDAIFLKIVASPARGENRMCRWRRDNFQKIASPSQAKNRSCSRGFTTKADFLVLLIFFNQDSFFLLYTKTVFNSFKYLAKF